MANSPSNATPAPEAYFIEPLDVLVFRGNKLFGSPGSYGENLMPPWPSVVAGALRTHILDRAGVPLPEFMRQANDPRGTYGSESVVKSLGTVAHPGTFAVLGFSLGRRRKEGRVERLFPLPQDLFVVSKGEKTYEVIPVKPFPLDKMSGVSTSAPLPYLGGLALREQSKGKSGLFLTEKGFMDYLAGRLPSPEELVPHSELWEIDLRVGIGMDPERRMAADGALFSSETISLKKDVGFVVEVAGAAGLIADQAILRLGGDGRGAHMKRIPEGLAPFPAPPSSERVRVVLTTPGLFSEGSLPMAVAESRPLWSSGPPVCLLSAALGRGQTVSGWDMARHAPKLARKTVPTGSVFWCEVVAGSPAVSGGVRAGISLDETLSSDRVAEGYNRAVLAPWFA